MFDTHCHLNFKSFKKTLPEVIETAKKSGVSLVLIPGTDVTSSRRAVEISQEYEGLFAAVGIHPHHVYDLTQQEEKQKQELKDIESLLQHPKVLAVGEVGMDRHVYEQTKYTNYAVDERFISLQRDIFTKQVELAVQHNKSLIVHNREAKDVLLNALDSRWDATLKGRSVFHCCEPDMELLDFAKKHEMYIGVDGDITYRRDKQEFIKSIPLEMLVVETDSPFLLPEPLRTEKKYPNRPENIPLIIEYIAGIIGIKTEELAKITTRNSKRLFGLPEDKT